MLTGTIEFRTPIRGNGLEFPAFSYDPKEPGVAKVEIEGPGGSVIRSVVHLISVATVAEGRALAARVNTTALDRIAYFYNISMASAKIIHEHLYDPQPGLHAVEAGDKASLFHETTASGRVTRRASSDPACFLRVSLWATAFGE